MSDIKVDTLEVRGKTLRYKDTVVSIANISQVTTSVPRPSFPVLSLVLVAAGAFLMVSAFGRSSVSMGSFLIGFALAAFGVGWIYFWASQAKEAPKGLTFCLNSGERVTITFSDHALADQVMASIMEAMQDRAVSQTFNLPNSTVINSPLGNVGSLLGVGR